MSALRRGVSGAASIVQTETNDASSERYSCMPVCRITIDFESAGPCIGPAGDVLYVPLRIIGGAVTGLGVDKRVLYGSDFASMYADEKLVHDGKFVIGDSAGNALIWYDGTSRGQEGAYDELLEGTLPGAMPSRLNLHAVSTNPQWKILNGSPLLGVGSFDGSAGKLEFTLLSISETALLA